MVTKGATGKAGELLLLGYTAKMQERFLAGKHNRGANLESAVHIFLEFLRGFDVLDVIDRPCVTVFGSARLKPGSRYYEMARAVGRRLAEEGFGVMTGGGPGIMEAANRGAKEGGGLSIGCSIVLPFEQQNTENLDIVAQFDHFFVRKVMLVKYSCAFIVMPGGYGTLDEMFETATLIQTKTIENFPIVAMGVDFWQPIGEFMHDSLYEVGTIGPEDVYLFKPTDSVDEAVQIIAESLEKSGTQLYAGGSEE
jgi:uncharacterized protein (TIGR00730 family)